MAVRVSDVSKTFRIPVDRPQSVKQRILHPRLTRAATNLEALRDISFEVADGEFLGIVGRNGAGKSTLLKCIAGIYSPTAGQVEVAGRVSPFLELGVGFNPELTARENVVLASSLIGIAPQRAKEKFGEIIEFAELEDFVDLKHKNYSTGMAMRLAFATAIHVDADILLIDEALAVGDAPFKEKSYQEFWRMKDEGQTIVFVTHATGLGCWSVASTYAARARSVRPSTISASARANSGSKDRPFSRAAVFAAPRAAAGSSRTRS